MSALTKSYADTKIKNRRIMMFAKSNDPDSQIAREIFAEYSLSKDAYEYVDIEKRQDCRQLENYFRYLCFTDHRKSPYIFINQLYFGSLFELNICHKNGSLRQVLS
ncbi:unnamed protein product [Rotaria magnacalcarata]|uniref:Uncharacterized protein n=1 Tax=Rotaria magnacalcarata TaxID=392030 RepID=A0A816XTG5_9BILA|nr:unnamed protein product [Rotaria magnacalcarata]CAF1619369.1 unnamed protein product [Rotaria magnacalcarata]CAF1986227.1 unnamed protein product [Rotaria magnacalcarata]CAF2082355.1 unnamed protein product [Rotaria magnacalcarata]CAF2150623.1 unnamed protein product [Rotaria magnacalcarata]